MRPAGFALHSWYFPPARHLADTWVRLGWLFVVLEPEASVGAVWPAAQAERGSAMPRTEEGPWALLGSQGCLPPCADVAHPCPSVSFFLQFWAQPLGSPGAVPCPPAWRPVVTGHTILASGWFCRVVRSGFQVMGVSCNVGTPPSVQASVSGL